MLYVDLYLSSVDIFCIINVGGVKTAQNIAALAEAEEKRNIKLADERAELRERIDDQIEEKDTDIEMAECEDMEVQPVSLTVKEKQEVREMVTCLLRQGLGKLGHLVTRCLDGHGAGTATCLSCTLLQKVSGLMFLQLQQLLWLLVSSRT